MTPRRHVSAAANCLSRFRDALTLGEIPSRSSTLDTMTMKMKAYDSFDHYLAGQAPGNQIVIRALREFVQRVAPHLEESVKWGNGCWVQGKVPVAYVYSAPDHVQSSAAPH